MAEKRMFSKQIIDSDAFLDMPLSTQALYFHLSMRADDDGFLNNAKKIMRTIGANHNDYDLLLVKKFIIQFDDGICVIKHWRINNYLRTDRYKETIYKDEKSMLSIKENGAYTLNNNLGIPNGYQTDTKRIPSIDKNSIDKNSIDKNSIVDVESTKVDCSTKVQLEKIIEAWNELGLSKIISIKNNRAKLTKARIKEYGLDKILEAIKNIKYSKFLQGNNDKGWTITFDWFIKPNNFTKVIEGNYKDKQINTSHNDKNVNSFNNFEPREIYEDEKQMKDLENKLLGWDKED